MDKERERTTAPQREERRAEEERRKGRGGKEDGEEERRKQDEEGGEGQNLPQKNPRRQASSRITRIDMLPELVPMTSVS